MAQHEVEALILRPGDATPLPDTLSKTRHLSLVLVSTDARDGTATFELRNPEAEPDSTVAALVDEAVEDVETANAHRETFHLPEKAVPVDTSTAPRQTLNCTLEEKLQIGDRVWTVTEIADDQVTLTPGKDHETHTLVTKIEELMYGTVGPDAAGR